MSRLPDLSDRVLHSETAEAQMYSRRAEWNRCIWREEEEAEMSSLTRDAFCKSNSQISQKRFECLVPEKRYVGTHSHGFQH
ncbi:hypothetical protein ATANTOWER_015823 [Ataeniobius toweri]|uniref:Uncharacterized protein n=1 Tax=Ataeniobius toweri TaxID=208326 RepID=A0ABU7ARS6_9TELE|nr:hypothetical protein [Ataeniobius toweri]